MNSITKIAIVVFAGLVAFPTAATADVNRGQKIYIKKLKAACGFDGGQFAIKHTQKEWADIKAVGKFADEIIKICPKGKIDAKFLPDLYDFTYHYGRGSGNVPSC